MAYNLIKNDKLLQETFYRMLIFCLAKVSSSEIKFTWLEHIQTWTPSK